MRINSIMDQELNKKPATILKPSHISVPLIFTVTIMTLVSQVSTLRLGKKKKKLNRFSEFAQLLSGRPRT